MRCLIFNKAGKRYNNKPTAYFNEPAADLNNEAYFPSGIYERAKDNPNLNASCLCVPCNDSLDEYASRLSGKILSALTA